MQNFASAAEGEGTVVKSLGISNTPRRFHFRIFPEIVRKAEGTSTWGRT
jgi:hypothetical protein